MANRIDCTTGACRTPWNAPSPMSVNGTRTWNDQNSMDVCRNASLEVTLTSDMLGASNVRGGSAAPGFIVAAR